MAEQQLSPDAPATERQRQMLKIAIAKEALFPNPFSGQYEKWENLTAGEADKLLSTIPPDRLGVLEKEFKERQKFREHRTAHAIGKEAESIVHDIGRTIDGGF